MGAVACSMSAVMLGASRQRATRAAVESRRLSAFNGVSCCRVDSGGQGGSSGGCGLPNRQGKRAKKSTTAPRIMVRPGSDPATRAKPNRIRTPTLTTKDPSCGLRTRSMRPPRDGSETCWRLSPQLQTTSLASPTQTKSFRGEQGDMAPDQDFRGVYSTILEDWLSLDPVPIVDGQFEQPKFVEKNGDSA